LSAAFETVIFAVQHSVETTDLTNANPRGRADVDVETGGDFATTLTPLTGRDTEVSLLADRWEQAQEGMGQVVLILGEAGLGKSRLVHTLKELVLAEMKDDLPGVSPVIEWRCSPRHQDSELYPAAEHLARLLHFDHEESTAVRFDRLARHLEDCGLDRPEVVALFAKLLFLPADERYPEPGLTPVRQREETFRAVHEWLRACSRRRPVLFVIEDIHWIDASSLEFLGQFIAEGLHDRIHTCSPFARNSRLPGLRWLTRRASRSIG
jgi:predicted ATPase